MINEEKKNMIYVNLYAEVSVSDELYKRLCAEKNADAIDEFTEKYGYTLATDKKSYTLPDEAPVVISITNDDEEELYEA